MWASPMTTSTYSSCLMRPWVSHSCAVLFSLFCAQLDHPLFLTRCHQKKNMNRRVLVLAMAVLPVGKRERGARLQTTKSPRPSVRADPANNYSTKVVVLSLRASV